MKKYTLYEGIGHVAENKNLEGEVIGKRLQLSSNVNGAEFLMILVDLSGQMSDIGLGFISDEERSELMAMADGARIAVQIEVGGDENGGN